MLPLLVRALRTADEVALSAEARGFGARPDRTYFDALAVPATPAARDPTGARE
jgi:energy-coupling factor transport system permease protein